MDCIRVYGMLDDAHSIEPVVQRPVSACDDMVLSVHGPPNALIASCCVWEAVWIKRAPWVPLLALQLVPTKGSYSSLFANRNSQDNEHLEDTTAEVASSGRRIKGASHHFQVR
jgi:hypothetical protein